MSLASSPTYELAKRDVSLLGRRPVAFQAMFLAAFLAGITVTLGVMDHGRSPPVTAGEVFLVLLWCDLLLVLIGTPLLMLRRLSWVRGEVWSQLALAEVGFPGLLAHAVLPNFVIAVLAGIAQVPMVAFLSSQGRLELTEVIAGAVIIYSTLLVVSTACFSSCFSFSRPAKTETSLTAVVWAIYLPALVIHAWVAFAPPSGLSRGMQTALDALLAVCGSTPPVALVKWNGPGNHLLSAVAVLACNLAIFVGLAALARWLYGRFNCAVELSPDAAPAGGAESTAEAAHPTRLMHPSRPRVWDEALEWKSYYFIEDWQITGAALIPVSRKIVLRLASLAILINAALLIVDRDIDRQGGYFGFVVLAIFTLLCVVLADILQVLGGVLHQEVVQKTLPALVLLPLASRELVWRMSRGAVRALLPELRIPGIAVTVATLILFATKVEQPLPSNAWAVAGYVVLGIVSAAIHWSSLAALVMITSLDTKSQGEGGGIGGLIYAVEMFAAFFTLTALIHFVLKQELGPVWLVVIVLLLNALALWQLRFFVRMLPWKIRNKAAEM